MLTKTGIEYLTHSWNFYPGCKNFEEGYCPVGEKCWARSMKKRFGGGDFTPHLIPEKLLDPLRGKQGGRRIGVNFTGDTCGSWVDPEKEIGKDISVSNLALRETVTARKDVPLKRVVFNVCNHCLQDTFLFLTKCPDRLKLWEPFPDNAWVGVSVCDWLMFSNALGYLLGTEAKVKYLSLDPLKENIQLDMLQGILFSRIISWVVIGGWDKGINEIS